MSVLDFLQFVTENKKQIQAEKFKSGPFTSLHVEMSSDSLSQGVLQWSFTFLDLGMCHNINSQVDVTANKCNESDECVYLVNGVAYPNIELACFAIFDGHYSHFLACLYQDVGFT
jgi:hypothetical protein